MRFWMLILLSRVALAQPAATPSAFETCRVQRKAQTIEAMKIADPDARARRLLAMPICRREADGSVEVVDPTAPPLPEPPFEPRAIAAVTAGVAASIVAYNVRPATSLGPTVEAELGWQLRRRFSIGAFGGFSSFHDDAYLGSYDVRHRFYDVGARVRYHVGGFRLGAGAGVELDDAMAFADVPAHRDPLLLFSVDALYPVARVDRFEVVVRGVVSFASSALASSDLSMYGNVISARLGIGFAL